MNITRTDIDALNAVINISLDRKDFGDKVARVLNDYRKNANIPGFRKGHVPMGMIKKQYETAVTADEVNKILREQLETYLREEKIDLLGNPLPKAPNEAFDWKADQMQFDFELGIAPQFEVRMEVLKKVIQYQIEASDKMIDEQLKYIRKQYGKLVSQAHPDKDFEITAQFVNTDLEIDTIANFTLADIKAKKAITALKAATTSDTLTLDIKGLFQDDATVKKILKLEDAALADLKGTLEVSLKEVNQRVLAELNQELFDKLYEAGTVTSEKELRLKVKEGMEQQFVSQSDQKLLNDVTECLVEKTKFDLPADFLKKWMQTSGKETLSAEEAIAEYDRSEKGIRYQLIEGKIIEDNKLELNFEELKDFTADLVRNQMMQYGQQPEQEQLDGIVGNILQNPEESRRISDQLMTSKMLNFFKAEAPLKVKKVSFDTFVKEAYGKA